MTRQVRVPFLLVLGLWLIPLCQSMAGLRSLKYFSCCSCQAAGVRKHFFPPVSSFMCAGPPPVLLRYIAPVYHQLTARDERRLIRGQIQHAVCYLCRRPHPAHRDTPKPLVALGRTQIRQSLLTHGRVDPAWMHRVAPDVVLGVLD